MASNNIHNAAVAMGGWWETRQEQVLGAGSVPASLECPCAMSGGKLESVKQEGAGPALLKSFPRNIASRRQIKG